MVRLSIAAWLLGLAAACGADSDDVRLALTTGCDGAELAPVRIVSVDVYGNDDRGELCFVAKRCLFDLDEPASLPAIVRAMQEANQPLVDVAADGARWLGVVGHTTSCWASDDAATCGFADLRDTQDGELEVELGCAVCDDFAIPLCP